MNLSMAAGDPKRSDYRPLEISDEPVEAIRQSESKRTGIRREIQGLRAVAIAFVLVFHLWPEEFPFGYLGVDVFFVISGYLMCLLLTRRPLTLADTIGFYFRRFKRILPTYLFVIAVSLLAAIWIVSPFEFAQVAEESLPSLFFYSNLPSVHQFEYFDFRSEMRLFLHTWSLSVELQFYTIAPLLVALMSLLSGLHSLLTFAFLGVLAIGSFYRQSTVDSNAGHMMLEGRIWEFLFGFFAHFAHNTRLLDCGGNAGGKKRFLVHFLPLLFLFVLLSVELFSNHQLQRLFVILVNAVLISTPDGCSLLSWDPLVRLGDASYSIYLVHWPLFTLYRSWAADGDEGDENVGHLVGMWLISASLMVAYCVETAFKRVLGWIKGWRSLCFVLLVFYAAAGILSVYLEQHSLTLIEEKPLSNAAEERRLRDTIMLWETRDDNRTFSVDETFRLNKEIAYFYETCHDKSRRLPSNYTRNLKSVEKICKEQGTGNKTIIVLGNSHAYKAFIGVSHMFKPVARTITLLSTPSCTPVLESQQQSKITKKRKKNCVRLIETTLRLLEEWVHPPDIVITLFGFMDFKDLKLAANPKDDSMLQSMQSFYSRLSEVVNEVVLLHGMHVKFKKNPLRTAQTRLSKGKKVGVIGETRSKQLRYLPNTRKRLEMIECSKCLRVDWLELWCEDGDDGMCFGVDPTRDLSFFYDSHHPSTLGAFYMGDYLLSAYHNFTNDHEQ